MLATRVSPELVLVFLDHLEHERHNTVRRRNARLRADTVSGKRQMMHVPGPAFTVRFLLHVLSPGFKRIWHYGLLAPAHKTRRPDAARRALAAPMPEPDVIDAVAECMRRVAGIDRTHCRACTGHFVVTALIAPRRLHGLLA